MPIQAGDVTACSAWQRCVAANPIDRREADLAALQHHFADAVEHFDVPRIEIIYNDIPDEHAPMGARGIGEIGITGVAAAVANAVYHATGKRVRELPITPDRVLL